MHPVVFLSAGMMAGLGVSLALRFVWSTLAARDPHTVVWQTAKASNELLYVGSHCLLGAALGGVFWLSWGMAGLVNLLWWQRGLYFAAVLTVTFGVLPLWLLRSLLRVPMAVMWCWVAEIAALTLAVGLNCSWQWQTAW